MDLYNELNVIEQERNPFHAIKFVERNNIDDMYVYLRVLFLLQDFLLYDQYSNCEHDEVASKFKTIYKIARGKFTQSTSFNFYSALMISIAENYFENNQVNEAERLLIIAVGSDPDNILFNWGLNTIPDQRPEVNSIKKYSLSKAILNDSDIINDLEKLGLLGKYILGMIEATFQVTKMFMKF